MSSDPPPDDVRLDEPNHAVQGAIVFGLLAVGTVTQLVLAKFGSRRVVLAGSGLFRPR